MSGPRQLLGALVGGGIVIALIAGGLALSTGDASIAQRPATMPASDTPAPTRTPTRPSATPASPSARAFTPTPVPPGVCPRPEGWIDYRVKAGDDLASIALRFGINPAILQVRNCLTQPAVAAGQVLFVPFNTPTATASIPPTALPTAACGAPFNWVLYTVRPGDTLSSLARATGTTVDAIMLANCLTTQLIRAGDRLFLPRQPIPTPSRTPFIPTATPTPTPTPSDTPSVTATTEVPSPTVPTDTPTATPSETPIVIQTSTPTPTFDVTPTDTPPPPSDTPVGTP